MRRIRRSRTPPATSTSKQTSDPSTRGSSTAGSGPIPRRFSAETSARAASPSSDFPFRTEDRPSRDGPVPRPTDPELDCGAAQRVFHLVIDQSGYLLIGLGQSRNKLPDYQITQ